MEKPKKRSWWKLIVIIVVIILCLIGAWFALLTFGGAAGAPEPYSPPLRTTVLTITITKSKITNENGTSEFIVPKDSDLALKSSDGVSRTCTIAGTGDPQNIQLDGTNPSLAFQLSAGSYKLTCGSPRPSASITAK